MRAIAEEHAEPMPFLGVSTWVWIHRPKLFALVAPPASPAELFVRLHRCREALREALSERKALRFHRRNMAAVAEETATEADSEAAEAACSQAAA